MKALRSILLPAAALWIAFPALAGPPLICQQFEIGSAKSLPWTRGSDWHGADPSYNLANLTRDTLALLAPATLVKVRMETLRRAAIYSSKDARLAADLENRLLARVVDSEAIGKADALAWFDAGYFAETIRQATFVYRYNMLNESERAAWQLRGDSPRMDGYPWVEKAIRMGGVSMEYALSLMNEFRQEDLKAETALAAKR